MQNIAGHSFFANFLSLVFTIFNVISHLSHITYRLISGSSLEQSTCKTRGKAAFDCVKRSMKLGANRLAHKRNLRIF